MKNKIIASLKERISRQNWENWFLDFNIRELKDNHVVFEVGNFFIKERLEKKI